MIDFDLDLLDNDICMTCKQMNENDDEGKMR